LARKPDVMDDAQNLNRISTLETNVTALQVDDAAAKLAIAALQALGVQAPVNQAVNSGDTTLVVTFSPALADANYAVLAMPDWATALSFSAKTKSGFTLAYGTEVPGTGHNIVYIVVGT